MTTLIFIVSGLGFRVGGDDEDDDSDMAKDESTDDHGDDDADGRHGRQHYHDAQKLTVILPKTMHQTHRLLLIVSTIIIFYGYSPSH